MGWRRFFRVVFPLTLLSISSAAPVAELDSRDISSALYDNLVLYSQYSAAAYCVSNNDSPGTKLSCSAGNCPLVEAANAISTTEFQHTFLTDDTGFLAVSQSTRTIILSFRGSQSVQNLLADIAFPFSPTPYCSGCFVHGGFLTSWREIRSIVLGAVTSAIAQNPGFTLVATGHSLGGAMASLAVADMRSQGIKATLYTYGSPRVGNDKWADYVTKQPGGNYRVTHRDDPVPRLAPVIWGFRHISPEYYITKGDDSVNPADIKVLEGGINIWGNSGTFGLNIDAHLHYFGGIATCGKGLFTYKV